MLQSTSDRVNQKHLSLIEDNSRRGLPPALACKSAPKWDPAESEINLRFISAIFRGRRPDRRRLGPHQPVVLRPYINHRWTDSVTDAEFMLLVGTSERGGFSLPAGVKAAQTAEPTHFNRYPAVIGGTPHSPKRALRSGPRDDTLP